VNHNDRSGLDDGDDGDDSGDSGNCAEQFADASQPYDPSSDCSGASGEYGCIQLAMSLEEDRDAATFYAQAAAMGCASAAASEVAQPAAPALDVDAETGGTGVANKVLKWLSKALKKLAKFKVKSGSQCDTDLSDIGLSAGTIQTIASTVSVLNAATTNPAVYMSLEAQSGDFGVITGTAGPIYYDQNNFRQPSLKMLMVTLIHEFSHVNGFGDTQDQTNLGLIVGAPTMNITKKIATDCFGYKGPIE
jgi:hypothetical protein